MAATSVIGSSISKIIKSSSFVLNNYPYTLSVIAVASQGTIRIHAYPFIDSAGFGTKYANPATVPGIGGGGVAFNPAGTVIAITTGTTPHLLSLPTLGLQDLEQSMQILQLCLLVVVVMLPLIQQEMLLQLLTPPHLLSLPTLGLQVLEPSMQILQLCLLVMVVM